MAVSMRPPEEGEEGRYQPLAEINVTPMVDVMLVLLVICMVAAPLLTVSVPIDLPKTTAATVTEPKKPIIVSINRDDAVFIGDLPVALCWLQPAGMCMRCKSTSIRQR